MSTRRRTTGGCIAAAIGAAIAVSLYAAPPVSLNWGTGPALGSLAILYDGRVTVYRGPMLGDTEDVAVAGVNHSLSFDNGLNLLVGNSGTVNQVLTLPQAAPHVPEPAFGTASTPSAMALTGDGSTLYVASPGGAVQRFKKQNGAYTQEASFTVPTETMDCIGIDLGADQTTLYTVSGGGNVLMVSGADQIPNGAVATATAFTPKALNGGAACKIKLLAPERGSLQRNHGGALIAFGKSIKRLNRAGAEVKTYKSSGSGSSAQNWVDIAVDPRMVYDAINPTSGIDPNEYSFWGIDAERRYIARFDTTQEAPELFSTGLDVPKGIAINGELRVAQVVRHVTTSEPEATFLDDTAFKHSWSAKSEQALDLAVMAFEVLSNGTAPTGGLPGAGGRCTPSLDVDCRFVQYFSPPAPPAPPTPRSTPTAVAYSRGRAVVYRIVPFAAQDGSVPNPVLSAAVTYADTNATPGGASCPALTPAVSVLRDPYLGASESLNGHDQFSIDRTFKNFDGDDRSETETDPMGGTDYIAVLRTDTQYSIRMVQPDPTKTLKPQLGKSLPIVLDIYDPNTCAPVLGLDPETLVLTVTEFTGDPSSTKGTVLGDSETEGSLIANGLEPWRLSEGQWRTNLALVSPPFTANNYYAICVNSRAVANVRLFGDVCAIVQTVQGSGK